MPLLRYAKKLDQLYDSLNRREYVHPDPLEFLYKYDDPADQEVVGLIASSLAYGRVGQILKSVEKVLSPLGENPAKSLIDLKPIAIGAMYTDFRHRFQTGKEISALLCGIGKVLRKFPSLASIIQSESDNPLVQFVKTIDREGKCHHLLPNPAGGSACKRLHLFLRWMVRCDEVDLGLWKNFNPARLIIPLDTHMHKIALAIGITKRKTASMRTALEITDAFRTISPADPVRYDFALTRLGIRNDMSMSDLLGE